MSLPEVEISSRGAKRLRAGHVWIYRSDVLDSKADAGDVVRVVARHRSGGRNVLGVAFYNPESLICLRFFHRQDSEPDVPFWRAQLKAAFDWRKRIGIGDGLGRMVYAEADNIPGLIVDRYEDVFVLQTGCAGADRLLPLWVDLLKELLQAKVVVERNDTSVRRLEGLEKRSGVLAGQLDGPFQVKYGGLIWPVDVLTGQKTGMYLDQRENHLRAAEFAKGRCLDVFSYQGGFGLHMARGGAGQVTLVDQSEKALAAASETAELNGLEIGTVAGNAFDFLREQQSQGARYDMISLDPPAFAKNKHAVEKAYRGYKEINLRAMKMLEPGGLLFTSSCSYHLPPEGFEQMLEDAAMDAGRDVQIIERRFQSSDHPERVAFPEASYLKCFILRMLS